MVRFKLSPAVCVPPRPPSVSPAAKPCVLCTEMHTWFTRGFACKIEKVHMSLVKVHISLDISTLFIPSSLSHLIMGLPILQVDRQSENSAPAPLQCCQLQNHLCSHSRLTGVRVQRSGNYGAMCRRITWSLSTLLLTSPWLQTGECCETFKLCCF